MSDPRPRRRLPAARRRDDLLAAAEQAFGTRGYADVTVAAVAADAQASEALAFRYFASKAELYAEVLKRGLAAHARQRREALDSLPVGTPVQARLRASVTLHLDWMAARPRGWSAATRASEPPEAAAVRAAHRAAETEALRELLAPSDTRRHEYALWAFQGSIDAACEAWAGAGFPRHDREPIVEACLGALEGALGDWAA